MQANLYHQLLNSLVDLIQTSSSRKIIGIYGPQGSGKSTLASKLEASLHARSIAAKAVSLDDFYYSRDVRQQLAQTIHPLLATRGVPGTHDVALGVRTFQSILSGQATKLPVFDKSIDDLAPKSEWLEVENLDVLIFEGWCLGLPDILEQDLNLRPEPLNQLEANQDPKGIWREYIANENKKYQMWYDFLTYRIGIKVPSFDCVIDWRWQQEQELLATKGSCFFQTKAEVAQFVEFFQRITTVAQPQLQTFVDCLIAIDDQHQWQDLTFLQ